MNRPQSGPELAARFAAGDTSPEVLAWARAGIASHLQGQSLEQALGLHPAARKREVYRLIGALADLLDVDDCGPWGRALRVEQAIRRFEANVWPRRRLGPVPLCLPSDELLARLFLLRVNFPKSQGGIYAQVLKPHS